MYSLILFQYYEMSYGLNVEMHKQTEIVKRMSAIIGQVLLIISIISTGWTKKKCILKKRKSAMVGVF